MSKSNVAISLNPLTHAVNTSEAKVPESLSFGACLLHPNFVLRVAGEPYEPFYHLHDGATRSYLFYIRQLRERMAQINPIVCDSLQRAVFLAGADREACRALLSAKRAVYNSRPFKLGNEIAAAWLAPDEHALLNELTFLVSQLAITGVQFAQVYDAELERSLERFRGVASDASALMGGILYTNAHLYRLVNQWVRLGVSGSGKAARRLQSTLLDFAMRSAFKTSPLSSFTSVLVGTWCNTKSTEFDLGNRNERTEIKLNHTFLLCILERIWRDPKSIGDAFPLELNPTIRIANNELHWQQLARSESHHGKFWGATHPQRKIGLSAPISAFLKTVMQMKVPINLASLTHALALNLPSHQVTDVRYFVETMLKVNLLHPRWHRYQQNDLLSDVIELAAQLEQPVGDLLATTGLAITELIEQYKNANLAGRVQLRGEIDVVAESMRSIISQPGAGSPLMPVFFEDCSFDGTRPRNDPTQWKTILSDLEVWLAILPLFDRKTPLHSWLADRFLDKYGIGGVCTDIEGFIRELGPELSTGGRETIAPILSKLQHTPVGASLQALKNEVLDVILAGRAQPEVKLDAEWCRALARRIPASVRRRGVSQVFFGQRTDRASKPTGFVVNRIYPGASMMFSRFMSTLSEDELDLVRAYIGSCSKGGEYLELSGVFGFNANLHPNISKRELLLAGSQSGRAGHESYNLKDMRLVYNGMTERLDILDASGGVHDIYYFGFLLASNLPMPYQLLARNESSIPDVWVELRNRQETPDDQPEQLPRVSIGGVVVSRRTWIIPQSFLPDPKGTVQAFALAFHALRDKFELPDDIFVRFDLCRADNNAKEQLGRNNINLSKPFYVNLYSPLHLRQLAIGLRNADSCAYIQEALPLPGMGTVRLKGRDHIAEIQIEMTLKGDI